MTAEHDELISSTPLSHITKHSAATTNPNSVLCLVEASIDDLQKALTYGSITSIELVSLYLRRISTYDNHGPLLNSIPIINPHVFDEARASDARRSAGLPPRPLEGIPYTVKDSYKVQGLTVASGSPAFKDLIAKQDAFTVRRLREAGAILIGKTNMPPMAAGGMQRGVYGRAESPYNSRYLTAAFASGSSNGSATSTAASFAAFGMAEETVSSGRSPASNNGLVAYTPSRGVISIRGNWPLYPTCDVVVPHTRSVRDLLSVLDVIVAEDENEIGDFWREQKFVDIPDVETIRPRSTYLDLVKCGEDGNNESLLRGKRIGAPRMYTEGYRTHSSSKPVHVRQSVKELWKKARLDLENLGAIVVETDEFPVVTNYEREDIVGQNVNVPGLPDQWNDIERSKMIAYAWNEFLIQNGDTNYPSLTVVDSTKIFPRPPASLVDTYQEAGNHIKYHEMIDFIKTNKTNIFDLPGLSQALQALETARKRDFEDWMDTNKLDFVAFPANGDVGLADSDQTPDSAKHAWLNGVKYSNGNRALRHLGIPTVTISMGIMEDTKMPVGLTLAGKAYDDSNLLRYAYGYECATKNRRAPGVTPALESDYISLRSKTISKDPLPEIQIIESLIHDNQLRLRGRVNLASKGTVYVDGQEVESMTIDREGDFRVKATMSPIPPSSKIENGGTISMSKIVVVVVAVSESGRTNGVLLLL